VPLVAGRVGLAPAEGDPAGKKRDATNLAETSRFEPDRCQKCLDRLRSVQTLPMRLVGACPIAAAPREDRDPAGQAVTLDLAAACDEPGLPVTPACGRRNLRPEKVEDEAPTGGEGAECLAAHVGEGDLAPSVLVGQNLSKRR
jgi:hypothetical protein